MNIIDKRKNNSTTFRDLAKAGIFEYAGQLWLKINYDEAFNFETEETDDFSYDTPIRIVKASIVIED